MGDFAGLTADGWIAIATFFSGCAVLVGALGVFWQIRRSTRQLVEEQEARDTRKYLLDDGVLALKEGIDRLLERTRRNYALVIQLIVLIRDRPLGNPLAPREIPGLLPELEVMKFESIGATSRLLNCLEVGELATTAFANLYAANISYEFGYRQPILGYYQGADWSSIERLNWCTNAMALAETRYYAVEEYGKFSHALGEAALRAQEMGLSKFSDLIDRIHLDPTMKKLAEDIRELLKQVRSSEPAEVPAQQASP